MVLSSSMTSMDKTSIYPTESGDSIPYHLVIDFMTKPMLRRLQVKDIANVNENTATLQTILQMLTTCGRVHSEGNELSLEWEKTILHVFRDICFPFVFSLHVFPPNQTEASSAKSKAFNVASRLMVECSKHLSDSLLVPALTQMFVPASQALELEKNVIQDHADTDYISTNNEPIDLYFSLELIAAVVNSDLVFKRYIENVHRVSTTKEDFLCLLFKIASKSSKTEVSFCKSFILMSKLLHFCSDSSRAEYSNAVWAEYCRPLNELVAAADHKEADALWKSLYVCYCLRDHFFPLGNQYSTQLARRMDDNFWGIVQKGLLSMEPAHRKLAMYLFKRLVDTCKENNADVNVNQAGGDKIPPIFWWSPQAAKQLSDVWDDFTLLIETLEEKQVHIIKPVLPKMQKLVTASATQHRNGLSLLHSSWLLTLMTRSFHHESYYMSRWAAVTLLNMDVTQVPLVRHGQLRFLSNDLIIYLQENKLYSRFEGTEFGKSSPVGEALRDFFTRLFLTLDKRQKVEYLSNVLGLILNKTFGVVPLVFIFEGLSHIDSNSEPFLNTDHLKVLRGILQSCLFTLEPVGRGAIQCFVCQVLIKHVDWTCASLSDVFATLASVNREECLQRGTTLWRALVAWLSHQPLLEKWRAQDIVAWCLDYFDTGGKGDNDSVTFEGYQVTCLARLLMLTADATEEIARSEVNQEEKLVARAVEASPLGQVLVKVRDSISGVRTRPYINTALVDRSLALLLALCSEARRAVGCQDDQVREVDKLLDRQLGAMFKHVAFYTQSRLVSFTQVTEVDEIKFHTDVLTSLGLWSPDVPLTLNELLPFVNSSLTSAVSGADNSQDLAKLDILSMSALHVLSTMFKVVSSNLHLKEAERTALMSELTTKLEVKLRDVPLPFSRVRSSESCVAQAKVGRVVSSFLSCKWQCLSFTLAQSSHQLSALDVLDHAEDDLSVGSGSSDFHVFQALEVVITQLVESAPPERIVGLLELGWQKVMEESKNMLFWKKLEALIPLALHRAVLTSELEQVTAGVTELLDKLWSFGCEKTGVCYLVMSHLCPLLTLDPGRQLANKWMDLIMDACIYGNVHKKGERLWLEVAAYIESLGPSLAVNQVLSSASKNDTYTRVLIINWISTLQHSVSADLELATRLTSDLWTRYLDLAGMRTYKQFSNGLCHRQKHRLVAILLMLADFITEQTCGDCLPLLWRGLELECHPSVRQMLEWLTLRVLVAFPHHLTQMWDVFKLYSSKRSICLCSLFLIIAHLGTHLSPTLQVSFYSQALMTVLPWTMAHHYNTRIYAQTTLGCLWQQCQDKQLIQVTDSFPVVQASVDFLHGNDNASNTYIKLMHNYMYTGLQPLSHFSMETIFLTLPRLSCLADDEWVSPEQFSRLDASWSLSGHNLPLTNTDQSLAAFPPGPWKTKAPVDNDDGTSESGHGDVQKKIMPWRQMAPDQETEAEIASQRGNNTEDGVIVVTSLVDKVPNLGGLCRTSEIFGVSEFVVSNLTLLDDRMFQTLSVTAQKWLNITEVLPPHLTEYLIEKGLQGYTLVGVEQTANSVTLEKFTFPKKTLLLLGNEKSGIPVEVIQLLDVCVEVPQTGIIRSLNVHVCGALIIWEYTRQQIQRQLAS